MIDDPLFYAAAIPAVCLVGLAKGGFSGLVILAMSLMTLVVHPLAAAAIMLPILIVQDAVTLWAYRQTYDRAALATLLPGAFVGIAIGALAASHVSEAMVRLLIGLVASLFALNYFLGFAARLARSPLATGRPAGWFWGAVSGFTSHVSHAGGPPYQVWMLSRQLPRDALVGTTSWYFAILNLVKLPFFARFGQMDAAAVKTSLALMPVALAATLFGIWLVRRTPPERFFRLIHALMLIGGLKLGYDGLWELFASQR